MRASIACLKPLLYRNRWRRNSSLGFSTQTLDDVSRSRSRRRGIVYVHWPFCSQLCSYCNFNKYVRDHVDHDGMTQCLIMELKTFLELSNIQQVTSIYFGGGTPSLAKPHCIERVVGEVSRVVGSSSGVDVCLEANPTSVETQKLKEFKLAGVNRLSLGVQSLRDADLRLMNRDHTVAEALRALTEAEALFPGRTNVDIIFGRPKQTLQSWRRELRELLMSCGDHVSVYQLTVERGTALSRAVGRGELVLPNMDKMADMYSAAVESLEDIGLQRYEISNFARKGCESQHNLSYWRGSNYIGCGPGAHSRYKCDMQFIHCINALEPNAWMTKVRSYNSGVQKRNVLSRFERLEEVVATSMRTVEGLTNEVWSAFVPNATLREVFLEQHLTDLITTGLLTLDELGIRATADGLNVLDSLLPQLLTVLDTNLKRDRI